MPLLRNADLEHVLPEDGLAGEGPFAIIDRLLPRTRAGGGQRSLTGGGTGAIFDRWSAAPGEGPVEDRQAGAAFIVAIIRSSSQKARRLSSLPSSSIR